MFIGKYAIKVITLSLALCVLNSVAVHAQSTGFVPPTESEFSATPLRTPYFSNESGANQENLSRFFPKPLQQHPQASCMGFAFSYALMTAMEGQKDRTRPYPYSPSYIYGLVKQKEASGLCESGATPKNYFEAIQTLGSPGMDEFPYQPNHCAPASKGETLTFSKMRKLANIERINDRSNNNTIDNVSGARDAILNKQPVVVGMPTGDGFTNYKKGVYPNAFYVKGSKDPNDIQKERVAHEQKLHAMVLVGFDNDINAFYFINSYGIGWGDFGYGWVSYDHIRRDDIWLWTAELGDVSNSKRIAADVNASTLEFSPSQGPLIGSASQPQQPVISSVAFGSAPVPGPAPQSVINPTISSPEYDFGIKIAESLRGTVGQSPIGKTRDGMNYYPVSTWLKLPKEDLEKISVVEYHWDAPSFVFSPKVAQNDQDDSFLVEYNGYGAVNVAYLVVKMRNGTHYLIDYPSASLWDYGELNEKDMESVRVLVNPDPLPKCPAGTQRRGRGACITL